MAMQGQDIYIWPVIIRNEAEMPHTNRVFANTFTYFDATLLTADFQIIEPGIAEPIFYLKVVNTSNVPAILSYDGVYGNDVVLPGDFFDLYLQTNAQPKSRIALFERGLRVYVKRQTNPGKGGYIFVISYYQPTI